jgi:poly(A) polymerase
MELFDAACKALRCLRDAGHESWLVGGSVRDHLMGTAVEDIGEFDIATSARPPQVEAVFQRSFAVGRVFGVVRVAIGEHWMEVATFRTEADYRDGRHPEEVRFATAKEDVQRRDFTVNGLLWNPETDEIVDHVGGREDVRQRRIRAIGDADERLREDALRLIRAVRFGAWHDFQLDEGTHQAIRRHASGLVAVSAERIRDELVKITSRPGSRRGDAWRLFVSTGLAEHILGVPPNEPTVAEDAAVIDALHHRHLGLWLAAVLRHVEAIGSPPALWRRLGKRVADRLRCSAEERACLASLLAGRARYRGLTPDRLVRVRLAATRDDRALHEDLLAAEGDAQWVLDILARDRELNGHDRPQPLLDGRRLMAAGVAPGPRLGWLLRKVRARQLSGNLATSEQALDSLGLDSGAS